MTARGTRNGCFITVTSSGKPPLLTTAEILLVAPHYSIDQVQPQILQTTARHYPRPGPGDTSKYKLLKYPENVPTRGYHMVVSGSRKNPKQLIEILTRRQCH